MKFAVAVSAALLVSSVTAQTCKPASTDLITLQNVPTGGFPAPAGGAIAPVDNAQGTYGGENVTFEFTGGFAKVVPTAPLTGYWFFKFEQRECWDGSGYNALEFDFTAPVGASFDMTFTVHDASCLTNNCSANALSCTRAPDSTYLPISKYVTPSGAVQHVVVPLADFSPNSNGNGTVDWRYIKDFTFIKFAPVGAEFTFNNFIMKAGCIANATTTTVRAVVGGTTAPAGAAPTGGANGGTVPTGTNAGVVTTTKSGSASSFGFSGLVGSLSLAASVFAVLF